MAMPINTADNSVNTYACTIITIISNPEIAAAKGTDIRATPSPANTLLNISANMAIKDKIASSAMWPPVILAARRIVKANGFTNIPMISIGIRIIYTKPGNPRGTRFFQCCMNPCAFVPAIIIEKKVIIANAAVTLKLPVAVGPP